MLSPGPGGREVLSPGPRRGEGGRCCHLVPGGMEGGRCCHLVPGEGGRGCHLGPGWGREGGREVLLTNTVASASVSVAGVFGGAASCGPDFLCIRWTFHQASISSPIRSAQTGLAAATGPHSALGKSWP